MERHLTAVEVAVRVLTAITEHLQPNQADVEFLLRTAPDLRGEPLDDLACLLVQRELRHAKAKSAA